MNPYYTTHKHAFEPLPNDSVTCRWCEKSCSDALHCNVLTGEEDVSETEGDSGRSVA